MEKEKVNRIREANDILFGESEGRFYIFYGDRSCRVSDYPYEPCLYIKGTDGTMVTIHNSFTVDTLCRMAESGEKITLVSGNEYDIDGIFTLIRKALELAMESVDVSYLEGHCFMDYMKTRGAVSPETAVNPADFGLKNAPMYSFLHSKKVGQTPEGFFYLREKKKCEEGEENLPNRNDDFFTTAEITEAEYRQIDLEYPDKISADRATAEIFRNKYVDGHPVIMEGWNKLP